MKIVINNITVCIAILALTCCSLNGALAQAAGDGLATECPTSLAEWIVWRDLSIDKARVGGFDTGLVPIQMTLQSCRSELAKLGKSAACFDRLFAFSRINYLSHSPGKTLGLEMTSVDYVSQMRSLGLGTLPSVFLTDDVLGRFENSKSAEELVNLLEGIGSHEKYDVKAFAYTSRHIESVDDSQTLGRIFLRIRGDATDFFAQYAFGGGTGQKSSGISVISVVKKREGKTLVRPMVYFNDLLRQRQDDGTFAVKNRSDTTTQLEPCHICHKSPLIPIVPQAEDFDMKKYGVKLSDVNDEMSAYAAAEYVGFEDSNLGPSFGIEGVATKEKLESCAGRPITAEETKSILSIIQCQSCHNGVNRARLTFPSGATQLPKQRGNLAKLFMVDYGLMPPSLEINSKNIRELAYRCLVTDLYGDGKKSEGKLAGWLKNRECFAK